VKYIYLIQSLENSYYKIGISKNPSKRIEQLQTGNPVQLKLIEIYQSEFANLIENTLQRKYNYLKKEGEWFDLSIQIETKFTEECKHIENSINILKRNNNFFI
jgi:predicted GIY-YIG superfamily endonuclease